MDEIIQPGFDRITKTLEMFTKMDEIDPDVLANACDRGTAVHVAIDAWIKGIEPVIENPDWEPYYDSVFPWIENKHFISTEERFYDQDFMVTGKYDAIYDNGKGLVLVDFKTSAAESKTWMLQGSAYAYFIRKNCGLDIQKIEFVRLKKDGKPCKIYTYEENFSLYLQCLNVYRYFTAKKRLSKNRS